MKTEKNMLLAFFLNFGFAIFELIGGLITGSVAILSDAVHDVGDAATIGVSTFLEKKSKRDPDGIYTYGYARYSVIGSALATLVLLLGSVLVIYHAITRIIHPTPIDYNGMIVFAIVGVAVNLLAAFVTREGASLNQKAVNLHMLEDVLGWVVVLVGAVVMKLTNVAILDPIMSIGVAVFIFISALSNLKEVLDLFLEKAPSAIDTAHLIEHLKGIAGVQDIHHLHLWSIDAGMVCATMHIVTNADPKQLKAQVREELAEHGIQHATLELEAEDEGCTEAACHIEHESHHSHGHHHHHHH